MPRLEPVTRAVFPFSRMRPPDATAQRRSRTTLADGGPRAVRPRSCASLMCDARAPAGHGEKASLRRAAGHGRALAPAPRARLAVRGVDATAIGRHQARVAP